MNKETVFNEINEFLAINWESLVKDSLDYGELCLTIATDDHITKWNYQTGDNSYTGGAYCLPHWAVVYIFEDSSQQDIFDDICMQLEELTEWLND